jgi:23S rRNA pseudouridine955/2504/2580 synthase
MSGVETAEVSADDDDIRLDRWFRRRYPGLKQGALEKLLRTGQVRVDGKRAKANLRLTEGQQIRIPPQAAATPVETPRHEIRKLDAKDAAFVQSLVIYRDEEVIALNKPPGLAVQGGTKTARHIDAMLDGLRFGSKERPRLVHRLDRDTSGILLLARDAKVAARLGKAFQGRNVRKIYWALAVGVPERDEGRIDLPLGKRSGPHGERMMPDETEGKSAVTLYSVVERAGKAASWLALWPLTGRTHQLRAHCAAIGHPVAGDGKYGGEEAFLVAEGVARQVHLHARELRLPHPSGRGELHITAELPPHMAESWDLFGFDRNYAGDPFAGIE